MHQHHRHFCFCHQQAEKRMSIFAWSFFALGDKRETLGEEKEEVKKRLCNVIKLKKVTQTVWERSARGQTRAEFCVERRNKKTEIDRGSNRWEKRRKDLGLKARWSGRRVEEEEESHIIACVLACFKVCSSSNPLNEGRADGWMVLKWRRKGKLEAFSAIGTRRRYFF